MQFTPKSERQIRDALLLPPGEYDFEVVKAEDKVSKTSGNEMIELQLRIFHEDGSPRMVRDYLVSSMELKLNRFCRAVGLSEAYQDGNLTAYACEGVSGRCKLTIQANEQYGDQNSVKDYLVAKDEAESPNTDRTKAVGVPAQQTANALSNRTPDDQIPF